MKFKHRWLVRCFAIGAFLVGIANIGLFYFNLELHTAIVGLLSMLLGVGYLLALGIQSHPG